MAFVYHTGARDRVPEGWEQAIERDSHEDVLRRAGLAYDRQFEFGVVHQWSVESLTKLRERVAAPW